MAVINNNGNTYVVDDRTISSPVNVTSFAVQGDANSRILTFKIARYFDGVDLSTKTIYVCYENSAGGTGEELCTDLLFNSSVMEFKWTVTPAVTVSAGTIKFYLDFRTIDALGNVTYSHRTKTTTQQIESSFTILNNAVGSDYTAEKAFLQGSANRVTTSELADAEIPFKVTDRSIDMSKASSTFAIRRDTMSQIMTFRVPAIVDGIDRSNFTFGIGYVNANGESDFASCVNIYPFNGEIFVGWALDSKVTHYAGTVNFYLFAVGYLSTGEFYKWSTKPASFTVEDTLDIESNIPQITNSWYYSWTIEADEIIKQSAKYCNEAKDYYDKLSLTNSVFDNYVNTVTTLLTETKAYADQTKELSNAFLSLHSTRSDKTNDVFETVTYVRDDGTTYMVSALQSTNNIYTHREETYYLADGTTVAKTVLCPLTFDADGLLTGEFHSLNQEILHNLPM